MRSENVVVAPADHPTFGGKYSAHSNSTLLTVNMVTFQQQTAVVTEDPEYGWASFVADLGGYVGLVAGASVLDGFDVLANKVKRK